MSEKYRLSGDNCTASELAHTAGKKLVAEGVENEAQARILIDSGADYLQGYWFGKPMPAAKLERHVEDGMLRVATA